MGTRSLLAYEKDDGEYYVQYMQFDGYPSVKGFEYYWNCTKTISSCWGNFSWDHPPEVFFKRIQHFLDEYQYASAHSVDNHYDCHADEWKNKEGWQEWGYLWDREGNFRFFTCHREGVEYVIPWEVTHRICRNMYNMSDGAFEAFLKGFFGAVETWFFEDPEVPKDYPILKIEHKEVHAFKEQEDNGWRDAGSIYVTTVLKDGKDILPNEEGGSLIVRSMWNDDGKESRNEGVSETYILTG